MRRAALAVAAVLVLAACSDDEPSAQGAPEGVTVGFLRAVPGVPSTEPAFVSELRNAGFVEGRNLTILAADPDEAYPDPEEAARVVRTWQADGVDLILALSSSGAQVAAETAPDVDVLFLSNDPTATGLVEDEQHPEGNVTGVTFRVPADRTLSLAQRAVPDLDRVGLAYPPIDPAAVANRDAVQEAADELGITLVTAEFSDGTDVGAAVDELAAAEVGALVLSTSPVATRAVVETGAAAERHALPVVANTTTADFAVLALSPDTTELGRQLGRQAARLLSGADAPAVPVEDPNRFVLRINRSMAARLSLTLANDLLREANEVIG